MVTIPFDRNVEFKESYRYSEKKEINPFEESVMDSSYIITDFIIDSENGQIISYKISYCFIFSM